MLKQKEKYNLLKLIIVIAVIVTTILFVVLLLNYRNKNNFKNKISNYEINKDKMETLPFTKDQLERAKKVIQLVKERDKMVEEVNSSNISINNFKYLDSDNYINYLKENGLFNELEDEKYKNRIQIAGYNILIPSYEIKNGKLVKINKMEKELNLIYTTISEKDEDGNIIYNSGYNDSVKIKGPYLNNDLLIIAIDDKDGDITDKITSEVKGGFKDLQKGKKYEVTYKIKNRNIEEKTIANIVIK